MTEGVSLAIMVHNEGHLLHDLLEHYAKYFDDIIVVDDYSGSKPDPVDVIDDFVGTTMGKWGSVDYWGGKVNYYKHHLDNNFGAARNFAAARAKYDYVLQVDPDEYWSNELLETIVNTVPQMRERGILICGFPRRNFIDQEPVLNYPDMQFRLHHVNTKWAKRLHECLQIRDASLATSISCDIIHDKTLAQQQAQNETYKTLCAEHSDWGKEE